MARKRIDGVYLIKNNITLRVRVGSAKDVNKRWSNYLAKLRNGTANKLMQEDYNWYGEDSFEFIILEECNVKDLFKREQYWFNQYNDCAMYNRNKVRNVNKKIRRGIEAKKYKEERSKITSGENNGHNVKLTKQDVKEIKKKLKKGVKQVNLAEQYKVSSTHIWNIKNGIRWNSIQV
ncbi:endonuclease [Clostridium botulinum]|uniref:GIY-YIG nuclease family protein n=1 Tax=Clostridium botulinum TaxID=1491 RepID=UPI0013F0C053|nr:GIY-YIG nuclease family protein [Clostridium botulinum]MBY6996503.1 GIY-YIG nuclease family protein [Clostridium botulinum]MBY7011152.1 GIY-YIG nuclease family protein [Clostridium botulinum]MCR1153616.1 GIY-YIG nuclease family protein [Clostridium botulinum]MCS6165699.1 endonuclease [Clostridium botulinum]NEZ76208.1 endonuclease [Clostridium botulinum]